MKFIALLKRDLTLGLKAKWYMYIYIIVLTLFMCINMHLSVMAVKEAGVTITSVSFWDYLIKCMAGDFSVSRSDGSIYFLPIWWIGVQFGIHYIIAYYPTHDYKHNASQIMIAGSSRINWWLSKCLWCLTSVLVYYGLLVLTALGTSLVFEKGDVISFSTKYAIISLSDLIGYMTCSQVILCGLILPIFITIGLAVVQMLLSFIFDATISFGIICVYYIVSSYTTSKWLLGNFTMFLRYKIVSVNGLELGDGIIGAGIIIAVSLIVGMIYFDRKDII